MDLSERPPEVREHIIQTAYQWCRDYFQQDWVQIREVADIPTAYPGDVDGYRVVVVMPDFPQGEFVDILVNHDGSMSGVHVCS